MMTLHLEQVARHLHAHVRNASTPSTTSLKGVSIDTRSLEAGNLFVALKGERTDGHQHLAAAQQKGAAAAIVSAPAPHVPLPQLVVASPEKALAQLAAFWRQQFSLPIIAITGSNGKTTLKNMLGAILLSACHAQAAQILCTPGNLNNHLGVPLTLLQLTAAHRYAAIEMGMNHFGEIELLTKITRPQVAVITNAGASHLAGVGDIAGVARAKAEIFLGLPPDGIAILNHDDAFFTFWRNSLRESQRAYLSFGTHPKAAVRLLAATPTAHLTQALHVLTPAGTLDINLPLLGKHNIANALAATAAALAIHVPLAAIKAGLAHVQPAAGRLQHHQHPHKNIHIIDDTYNANPFSLQAAIDTLTTFPGKKIVVLGDMKELGEKETALHEEAGRQLRASKVDHLLTCGELSANTTASFGQGACHFSDHTKLLEALTTFLQDQTTILVKGSRSMQMEQIVNALLRTDAS